MRTVVRAKVWIPLNYGIPLLQIVQFVRVTTETGGSEARSAIVDACDTLLNLLIKVPLFGNILGDPAASLFT